MSLILVVEPEERYIQRVRDALGSEGWQARTVNDRAAALRAAASEAPNLVLVSADVDGASSLIDTFARRSGGPGVVAIVDEAAAGGASAEGMGADDLLTKPFTDQELRLTVRRGLVAASKPAPRSPSPSATAQAAGEARFTSADIFGDLVAEVEGELARTVPEESPPVDSPPPPRLAPPPGSAAPRSPAPAPGPALSGESVLPSLRDASTVRIPVVRPPNDPPAAPAGRPVARPALGDRDRAEIDRRLEQTLSGVLGDHRAGGHAASRATGRQQPATPAAPPASTPAAPPTAAKATVKPPDDVDSLLSDTLAGLDLRAKPPRKQPPKEVDPLAGLDLSGLGDLSRPKRGGSPQAPPPAPPAPEPVAPVAAVGPAASQPVPATPPTAAPGPEEAERFGQYTLQERIAVGGMAEVWKARMRGVEGFQKTVAIKKILPHLTDNAEFVSMFIDEAKLAAQLNHPNIIHIYDLGKIAESYYIAMEYVEGRNLRTILDAADKRQRPVPTGLAVLVAARLASALDYAHKKRDFDNRDLGLVHRDVSPQNVLISFEGAIKLCDFGIAKAVAKASHTQMGALKGKLQYMSPEQAWGRTVDARSDIFSLGSLLFEMLTGQRLFTGDSEISVLEAVRECLVQPPGELVDGLPDAANEIVMTALAKEPDHRYQAASEMQAALEALLHSLKPTPGPAELTLYLEELSGARPVESRDAGSAVSRAETSAAEAMAAVSAITGSDVFGDPAPAARPGGSAGGSEAAKAAAGTTEAAKVAATASAAVTAPAPIAPLPGEGEVEESGGRGRWLLIAAIVLAAALLVAFFVLRPDRAGSPAPPADDPPASAPPGSVEPAPPLLEDTLPGEAGDGTGEDGGETAAGSSATEIAPAVTVAAAGAVATESPAAGRSGETEDPAAPEKLEAMVAERLAERERTLRTERETELRRLEAELAAAREPADEGEQPTAVARGEPEPAEETDAGRGDRDPAATRSPSDDAGSTAPGGTSTAASSADSPLAPQPATTPPSTTPPATKAAPTSPPATPATSPRTAAPEPRDAPPAQPEPPAVRQGDLVQPGPGVVPPKLVSIVKPEYPPVARRMRIQGDVILALLVDERGRVIDTRFIEQVRQNVGINEAALEAARNAEYEPATKDGVRVKMWTNIKLPFRL